MNDRIVPEQHRTRPPGVRVAKVKRRRDGYFSTQLRFGDGQRQTFKILVKDERAAQKRADAMSEVAEALTNAEQTEGAAGFLKEIAEASDSAGVREAQALAMKLCTGQAKPKAKPALSRLTFQQVGERWTSGDFHRDYPDQVEAIQHADNAGRLAKAIYPLIGSTPIREITRADCDRVMRALPVPKGKTELSRNTRRQYAHLMNRVLNLAELAGYIERSPLPRGWLPKAGAKKRFPILYAAEDLALLAKVEIPLCWRLWWGFLHREGMRRGEAAALQWRELDLDNGTIALDENKTDHARWWKLSPGTAAALAKWKAMRGVTDDRAVVFIAENGGPIETKGMAERSREHLQQAGILRADLTTTGPLKGQFGTHSFRRSFVTRSLALGKGDDFVRQRTGHTSEELLGYRQAAQSLADLEQTELAPLDEALPELSDEAGKRPSGGAQGGKPGGKQTRKSLDSRPNGQVFHSGSSYVRNKEGAEAKLVRAEGLRRPRRVGWGPDEFTSSGRAARAAPMDRVGRRKPGTHQWAEVTSASHRDGSRYTTSVPTTRSCAARFCGWNAASTRPAM